MTGRGQVSSTPRTAAVTVAALLAVPYVIAGEVGILGVGINFDLSVHVAWAETFRADGTVKITGGLSDRGYWRVWEQGYCTQWYRMRKGAERCFTLDRTADGKIRVFKPDGGISMTILSTKPIE